MMSRILAEVMSTNYLRERRIKRGLSQNDVAQKLQVKRSTVSMWETDRSFPRADKLPQLARLLGCSIDELFEKGGENP